MWIRSYRSGWPIATHLAIVLAAGIHLSAAWSQSLEETNFHHNAWTSEDGIGAVFDIEQASDGFLWLATSKGVLRFDGVRFQSVEEATHGAAQSDVRSFYLAPNGGIWLETRENGMEFLEDGKITSFRDRLCLPAFKADGMAEGQDGSLWIQAASGLFHLVGSTCRRVMPFPASILVDRRGTVWVETRSASLLYLPRGQTKFRLSQTGIGPTLDQSYLHQAPDGSIWLSDDYGLRRVVDSSGNPVPSSQQSIGRFRSIKRKEFTFAADGSLWTATDKGMELISHGSQRLNTTPDEVFTSATGLSSDIVRKVFIDREGSIWVGTNSGLDRFRRTAITPIAIPHQEDNQFVIAPGDNGAVWIGSASMPLTHLTKDGSRKSFPQTGGITCIRRDRNGTVWAAGRGKANLWRYRGARLTPLRYRDENRTSITSLAIDRNSDIWISTLWAEIYQRIHGVWWKRNDALGKPPGFLGAMTSDEKGNVWFAFPANLVEWDGKSYRRFIEPKGMPWLLVTTLAARGGHLWLGGEGGLEFFAKGEFHPVRWKDPEMPGRVSGVIETETGDLWINGFSGVTHVPAPELRRWIRDPNSTISGERFDALDGLPGLSVNRYPEPSVIESTDHRLWFATTKGVAWLDPAAVEKSRNRLPPPVVIYSLVSNGHAHGISGNLALPARNKTLEIDYTALSLAIPERVLFRYKLDGVDKEWQDAGTRREAFYTKLSPGNYRFHVIACNNDGVWNPAGAFLHFSIAPAYYQTNWFHALCVAALLGLLWMLHQFRTWKLRQSETKLRQVIAAIPTFAWTALPNGSVDFLNRHYEDYTGFPIEKALGSCWAAVVHPEDLQRHVEKFRSSMATGGLFEIESRFRRADGQYRWFLTRAVPLLDSRGKIVKWYGTSIEIEDRKRAEQLQADLARISRVNTMSELTASLAHEIKQPIGAAVTNAEACLRLLDRNEPDVPDAREAALEMTKDTRRAADIIDRVRLLYQKGRSHLELLDLNEVVAEMLVMLRDQANRHLVTMRADLAEGLTRVMADRVQLQQVFVNLMLNGIEAMKDNGGELLIKSQLSEDGELLISVADTGMGLPTEKADEIFNAFFTTKPEGTGLGLAITRSILESHGGRVWATANSGQGTIFYFTLPIRTTVAA